MKILIALLFTLSFNLYGESSLCKGTKTKYKGIYCCIDKKICRAKIEANFGQELLDEISKQNKTQSKYSGPNCYWAALNHLFGSIEYPARFIEGRSLRSEFSQILKKNFIEISREELRIGDLVVFYSKNVKERVMAEDMRSKVWMSFEGTTQHAAIWLGDNHLFQKEGSRKDNFSLSTFEESYKFYKGNLNLSLRRSGDLEPRFYKTK